MPHQLVACQSTLDPLATPFKSVSSALTHQLPIILASNARSLKDKVPYLVQLLEDDRPHIVIVTETWLNTDSISCVCAQLSRNPTSGEKLYSIENSERVGKRGGGIMVLVRSDYAESIARLSATPPISHD